MSDSTTGQANWHYAPLLRSPIDLDVIFNRERPTGEWIARVVQYTTDGDVCHRATVEALTVGCGSRLEALENLLEQLMGIGVGIDSVR